MSPFDPDRPIVLVGMMGAGKTTVGRRLANRLGLEFIDADAEIEMAAGRSIADIFEEFGEPAFRSGERRVVARLLEGKPKVLATGGGAFIDPDTRALIKEKAVSVWLDADIDVLVERTARRDTRPLLKTDDPEAVLRRLAQERREIYAEADIHVKSSEGPHDQVVKAIIAALEGHVREAVDR